MKEWLLALFLSIFSPRQLWFLSVAKQRGPSLVLQILKCRLILDIPRGARNEGCGWKARVAESTESRTRVNRERA